MTIDNNSKPVILVAEDDENSRLLLKMFLNRKNCEVVYAKNGLEVIELYHSGNIDLILMDIKMPGMDGCQATCEIRNLEKQNMNNIHIPIIGITALYFSGSKELFMGYGMNDVIFKPIDISYLEKIISNYLDLH